MRMNIRILIPLILFIFGFNAAAQKYQLRPVIVQVLPLGLDMTSKFGSNESGINDGSQAYQYISSPRLGSSWENWIRSPDKNNTSYFSRRLSIYCTYAVGQTNNSSTIGNMSGKNKTMKLSNFME